MIQALNQVLEYIEVHLCDEISQQDIASFANASDYQFRKVFSYLSGGLSLSEYIKNRRLSEAGLQLLRGVSVTEVAFIYGYQSVEGFSRAFKHFSGLLPSEVCKQGKSKTFPRIIFEISVRRGVMMEFRIEQKPAFKLAGVSKRVSMQYEGINNEIVALAQSITHEQREAMHVLQDIEPRKVVNASYDSDTEFLKEEGSLTHMIGVLTTKDVQEGLLEVIEIPSCMWAVFPTDGPFPKTLQDTMA